MNRTRIFTLLGPAFCLYLVADVVSGSPEFHLLSGLVCALGVACSLAPLKLRREELEGTRRAGALGVLAGAGLISSLPGGLTSLPTELTAVLGWSIAASVLIDLAFTVPDKPPNLRATYKRVLPHIFIALALVIGLLSVLPTFSLFGSAVLLPPQAGLAPPVVFCLAAVIATSLRVRRLRTSTQDALGRSAWALLGLFGALFFLFLLALLLFSRRVAPGDTWFFALLGAGAVLVTWGHAEMIASNRRVAGSRLSRALVSTIVSMVLVSSLATSFRADWPEDGLAFAAVFMFFLLLAAGMAWLGNQALTSLVTPDAGRLLEAVRVAGKALGYSNSLTSLAEVVLPPFRTASRDLSAHPRLILVDPAQEIVVDAAGNYRLEKDEAPAALVEHLTAHPYEIVSQFAMSRLVVRRPELRSVFEILVAWDALAVVPLAVNGELEGALVIPRGLRVGGISLEESRQFARFTGRLSGFVSVLSAHLRAQERSGRADKEVKDLHEEVEDLSEQLGREQKHVSALKTGPISLSANESPVAYGAGMREVIDRLTRVAAQNSPLLLVAEEGTEVDALGLLVHRSSGRPDQAFVVGDCGSLPPSELGRALFGTEKESQSQPGWLALAEGGTLLLLDVPALPLTVQSELAESIACHELRPIGAAHGVPSDVRLIATSRLPLKPLLEIGAMDDDLGRRLLSSSIDVPPLRDRADDFSSLVLLAIDRACRVVGRKVVGIEAQALLRLQDHAWPGNLAELQWVVSRAVRRTQGSRIQAEDLPTLTLDPSHDPLGGEYTDVEKRILERALIKSGGNKSEAARSLGLKRTTFLDKLRRYGVEQGAR